MRTLAIEIRHALRGLVKRPAVSLVVIATLALGLGANAAIFGVIDALVIRPFSIPDVDRIVLLSETAPQQNDRQETVSPADFLDWRRQIDAIDHLAALAWWDVNLVGRDEPERVQGFFVSPAFFSAFDVRPVHGRTFTADEETFGRHKRVVLGHALWTRRFGADPSIVGQAITLDAEPYDVVGVAPRGFDFPNGAELWAPLAFDQKTAALRTARYLTVIGRLRDDRALEDAQAQAAVVADRLARGHPESNRDRGIKVHTLAQGMLDIGLGPILSMWQASAAFVLLIACANIANLLLARGAERQRDIAVRLAIGASRARLVRELLVESALLALLSVPASLFVTWASLRVLRANLPATLVRFVAGWESIELDGRLVGVTLLLALGTAILFGILPALQASRPRLTEALKDGGRTATGGRQRLRRALVVAEIALALPLLVAAGLAVIGTNQFLFGPQGYDPDGSLTMKLVLPDARYADEESRRRFVRQLVGALAARPGVAVAAAANTLPSMGSNWSRPIEVDGRPDPDPANPPIVDVRSITPGFFDAMRIPMSEGRVFSDGDRETTASVAIVSRSMAQRFWPDGGAIGQRVRVVGGQWLTVVGVCGDVIHDWFGRRNAPTLYQPFAQRPVGTLAAVVRTHGDPAAFANAAREAATAVDPAQPVFDVMTMRQVLYQKTIGLRYISVIMTVFAGMALVLAVVGVYAVMAYLVTQRTHEIGVRIALGATPRDVVRLAVGQAGRLTAVGVAVGLVLSIALGRLIEAGLLGIASGDVRVSGLFAAFLIAAALVAGYVPARRAAAVDPIVALRSE